MRPTLMVLNGLTHGDFIRAAAAAAELDVVYYSGSHPDSAELEEGLVRTAAMRRVKGLYSANGGDWDVLNRAARRLGLPGAAALAGNVLSQGTGGGIRRQDFICLKDPREVFPPVPELPLWVRGALQPGYGVSMILEAEEELPLALRLAFRHGHAALLQPVLEGPTISVFGFKQGRGFTVLDAVGVDMQARGYRLPLGYTCPAPLNSRDYAACIGNARAVALALSDATALLEVEFVLDSHGPCLTDLRIHHDWEPALHALFLHAIGVDVRAQWFRVLCGEAPRLQAARNVGASVRWFSCRSGVIQDFSGTEKKDTLSGLVELNFSAKPGDIVRHCVDIESRDLHGYALCTGSTAEAAHARLRDVQTAIKLETSPYLE